MDEVDEDPISVEVGTDDVIDDGVRKGDRRELEQPQVRPARRRVAPDLDRDLLTYQDNRYKPLFAVADQGRSIKVIQEATPFLVQSKAPTIVLFDDSADAGLGPDGFDTESLLACVRRSEGAVIIVGDRSPALYAVAAEMAEGKKRRALLVETRPARLADWERSLLTARPRLRIAVGADPIDGAGR